MKERVALCGLWKRKIVEVCIPIPLPSSQKKFRSKRATHRNQACLNVNFLREFKQSLIVKNRNSNFGMTIYVHHADYLTFYKQTFFFSFSSEGPDNEASSAPLKVPMDNENDQENI